VADFAPAYARRRNGRVDKGERNSTTGLFGQRLNVWSYNVGYMNTTKDRDAYKHPALMPEAEAEDLIVSYSRPGDLVFDPFCGAGTTCKMALLNDRRYLGMEIHKRYQESADKRMNDARPKHRLRLDAYFSSLEPRLAVEQLQRL
jgi:site-specific DNA-methyltransferase (adenine-specific)